MHLRSDVSSLALQCRSDMFDMPNRSVENTVGFDYASRNEGTTTHV